MDKAVGTKSWKILFFMQIVRRFSYRARCGHTYHCDNANATCNGFHYLFSLQLPPANIGDFRATRTQRYMQIDTQ